MTTIIATPPAVEPVTIEEARLHLRISGTDEDALVARLISAARSHVEQVTKRSLITQGWRTYLDDWPEGRVVRLPTGPVQSVEAITIFDADGMPMSLGSDDFTLDGAGSPPRLKVKPAVGGAGQPINGIEIDFTAGYGDTAASVPKPLIQAILLLVGHWYEHREAGADIVTASFPFGFDALLTGYRTPRL